MNNITFNPDLMMTEVFFPDRLFPSFKSEIHRIFVLNIFRCFSVLCEERKVCHRNTIFMK